MASVHKKDGSPYWYAWYSDADGEKRSKSTEIIREPENPTHREINRAAALAMAESFEQQAKAGLPVGVPAAITAPPLLGIPTFTKFTRGWIRTMGGDEEYRRKLSGYFDNIDRFLGTKVAWQICRLHRSDFIGLAPFLLEMGYSPTTVTLHLKTLRGVLLAAVANGFILACPITRADYLVNSSPASPKAMSVPQIECLLNSTSVVDWRTAVLFGFYFCMDLMPAGNQVWDKLDITNRKVSWVNFTRAGKSIEMSLPMHPQMVDYLINLKKCATSEFVTPSLQGVSDSALRAHFRELVETSRLPSSFVRSGRNRNYFDIQFASLRLSFAREIGHSGLFRLSRFLRSMSSEELEAAIAKLPHLNLKPIPLLAAVECSH